MSLYLGEDLHGDDFGVRQRWCEATTTQTTVPDEASARLRHGDIDGDQGEIRDHGFFVLACSMACRSTRRFTPPFASAENRYQLRRDALSSHREKLRNAYLIYTCKILAELVYLV